MDPGLLEGSGDRGGGYGQIPNSRTSKELCLWQKKKKNPKRENGQVPRPGCVRGVVPQVYKDSVPRHISLLTFSFPM